MKIWVSSILSSIPRGTRSRVLAGAAVAGLLVPGIAFAAQTGFPDGINAGHSTFRADMEYAVEAYTNNVAMFGQGKRAGVVGLSPRLGMVAKGTEWDSSGLHAEGELTAIVGTASQYNSTGIRGTGVQVGVEGTGRTGVKATGTASIGVDATGATTGVKATSTDGVAVDASGKTGGVNAYSSDAVAVRATSGAVNGRGLTAYADQAGSQGIFAFGATQGIVAQGQVGGDFQGTRAPIRLHPGTTVGAPPATSGAHDVGELYVDSQGALWYCKASGTPGFWVRIVS
jgi:hypothetical protein